ncbi:MAG TPA: hypothetical protein VMT20_07275 [Terriglobia bacterium]|nr:hypothetical protein [Terriglobia bacterium]
MARLLERVRYVALCDYKGDVLVKIPLQGILKPGETISLPRELEIE